MEYEAEVMEVMHFEHHILQTLSENKHLLIKTEQIFRGEERSDTITQNF